MEEKRQIARPSALPRPQSRLPLPRIAAPAPSKPAASAPTSLAASARPAAPRRAAAPSKEKLGGEIRNPRLRPSISKDQIRATATKAAASSTLRRVASKPTLNQPTIQALRPSTSQSLRPQHLTDSSTRPSALSRKGSREAFSKSTSSIGTGRESRNETGVPKLSPTLPRYPSLRLQSASSQASAPSLSSTDGANSPRSPIADIGEESFSVDTVRPRPTPRPSLSERTIETLSRLPSSPAISKPPTNFFPQDSARRPKSRGSPGSRPGSSQNSDGSGRPSSRDSRGRPGSSSGGEGSKHGTLRASTNSYRPSLTSLRATPQATPAKKTSASKPLRTPGSRPSLKATPARPTASTKSNTHTQSPSPDKVQPMPKPMPKPKYGSRPGPKTKPPIGGTKKKPYVPSMGLSQGETKQTLVSARSSLTSETNPNSASTASSGTALTTESLEPAPTPVFRKSSAALRDHIAKVKAANRAASRQVSQSKPASVGPVIPTDTTFDFGLSDDPFNLGNNSNSQEKMMQGRIGIARSTGRLNIAALSLKEIPEQVMKMYDFQSGNGAGSSWAESVDLSRLVAADNELELIDEAVFPDRDPADMADDEEDSNGNIFGGLESLDLHGNVLISLPVGMRRLQLLTSLNLSSNRLANNCFEVISQITALRDLKLSSNLLSGPLDAKLNQLTNLEVLDIRGNKVSSFPAEFECLSALRIVNISGNSFSSLPFTSFAKLPLTEMNASKNHLTGVLIEAGVASMPKLQSLDVSCNQITRLVQPDSSISFPAMYEISAGMNRLQALPDVSSWESLLTLNVNENTLTDLPNGFFGLEKLRHADFSGNEIRVIPPELSRMDTLAMFRITGNPLRERKFASMSTDEMKASLAARLEPPSHEISLEPEPVAFFNIPSGKPSMAPAAEKSGPGPNPAEPDSDVEDFATPPTSIPGSPDRSRPRTAANQTWPVKPGGILDKSNAEFSSLHPVICSRVAAEARVYEVHIHHNLFASFPNSLSFFAETLKSLSLSHNQLVGQTYLTEELDLPALRELNLASNHITGLQPLITHLRAPELTKLDISLNRVTSLPPLRETFPLLAILLLTNNHLEDLDPNSIRGLEIVDASNNDIAHLNPRLGLLGGSKGTLKRLELSGNRFRVPRWNVLDRGTDATLKWLRSRVPITEMAEWKKEVGASSGSDSGDID